MPPVQAVPNSAPVEILDSRFAPVERLLSHNARTGDRDNVIPHSPLSGPRQKRPQRFWAVPISLTQQRPSIGAWFDASTLLIGITLSRIWTDETDFLPDSLVSKTANLASQPPSKNDWGNFGQSIFAQRGTISDPASSPVSVPRVGITLSPIHSLAIRNVVVFIQTKLLH